MPITRIRWSVSLIAAALLAVGALWLAQTAHSDGSCTSANPIVCENQLPGSPPSEWDVQGDGDPSIQGYATDISVDQGQTIDFKIKTDATGYRIDIYRLGYYQGNGARKVATITPSASLPQTQPQCLTQSGTGLIDCGNWSVSASWNVPADAVSGVYIARPVRTDTGGASHIPFIVRDDASHSDVLVQTSDETWEAYNHYGGNSLYGTQGPPDYPDYPAGTQYSPQPNKAQGFPDDRAYAVSYNRPFNTREQQPHSWIFGEEYPMIRWLERNGYDVSYFTDVDAARHPALITQHKLYLVSGHDEYWSREQRDNVEAAADAGVNLAFFTANESFWKTRFSSSIDGSSTPWRTVVTYKSTAAGQDLDPTNVWTGTWADPRWSPPEDGGRPANAMSGQSFLVNEDRFDAMSVPAADGKMRFWRNTSIANLAAGAQATLPAGVLGYEWDGTPDNAFRPPGELYLSSTTVQAPQVLQDYGSQFSSGTATHHLSLYRRPSGALVFGAGTVQWAWGLDDQHDMNGPDQDPRMQQATVNLLADMGVQPGSLQSNLVAATKSTDTTAPTATITSPSAGANLSRGQTVTISGTARDTGGGVVGGVEVSTDGGNRWHPADGRESWSYSWKASGFGTVTLEVRAVDDSGNLGSASSVNVTLNDCPCSVWDDSTTPNNPADNDSAAYELGFKFESDVAGYITGLRFYKGTGNTGTHVGHLWTRTGRLLATATFSNETATGWQQVTLDHPVAINAGAVYVASYGAPNGHFAADRPYFIPSGSGFDDPPLHGLVDDGSGTNGGNGIYGAVGAFPTQSLQSTNYWVDVVFATHATDTTPPAIQSVTPQPGANRVGASATVSASFSEALDPSTVNGNTVKLTDADGNAVAASVSYDPSTLTAGLDPSSDLTAGQTYTASIGTGIKDLAGNALAQGKSWSFTIKTPGVCPCTIWDDSTGPADYAAPGVESVTATGDRDSLELGLKFRSDTAGYITGVRFYKGIGNSGTHRGQLWTASGVQLASVTFTDESDTGWQEADFAQPVAIAAGTTYIVSYTDPDGHFAVTRSQSSTPPLVGGFATAGVDTPPLHALQDGVDGPDGVYGPAGSFPTESYLASNYWVDPIFDTNGADKTPPRIITRRPAGGSTDIATAVTPDVLFDGPMDAASVEAPGAITLTDPNGASVPASVRYDPSLDQATLTPASPLAVSTRYTMTVKGGSSGVKDAAGNALQADDSWSFTTAVPIGCPCTIFDPASVPDTAASDDGNAYELGVRFRSDIDGYVTGIRFYKGTGNTGTHVGHLWTTDGLMLGSATFSNETASGWQEVSFPTPVPVVANTVYIASYTDPSGHFAFTRPYFAAGSADRGTMHALADAPAPGGNGLYGPPGQLPQATWDSTNYWVDAVFTQSDTTAPAVVSTTPADSAARVATSSSVTATFSKAVDPATLTTSSFTLQQAGGGQVAATVVYDAQSRTATLRPSSPLAGGTTYTATVKGGSTGVKDASSNPMAADRTWTFTTFSSSDCPCTVFSPNATPATDDSGDAGAYELGTRFHSDLTGFITGVRFYKSALNTGTHVARLWSADGRQLAQATFTNESASGWQEVDFDAPVPVVAGTTYIASYTDPNGHFSLDRPGFAQAVSRYPLTAPADDPNAANGVFGAPGSFPTSTFGSTNYWVDPVFGLSDTTAPKVLATTPDDQASSVPTATTVTARFSEALDPSTVTASTFTLAPTAGGGPVAGTVSYDASSHTATLTPSSPLSGNTGYTVTLKGGASGIKDTSGNALAADRTSTFTTFGAGSCPCGLFADNATPGTPDGGDGGAYELGVRFRSDAGGYITGVRFYKSAANTGTHVARLWTTGGQQLAQATFTGESASGWQRVDFDAPVPVTAGTTYIASYTDPNGHFSVDRSYFTNAVTRYPLTAPADSATAPNGVFGAPGTFPASSVDGTNYWVDPVFTVTDSTPPKVSSTTPASSATGVPATTTVTATFSRAMDASTITGSTFSLQQSGGGQVPATVAYDAQTHTATLTPSAALSSSTAYTATVRGGATGVEDTAGNALAGDKSWSFTTFGSGDCPCSVFAASATPATSDSGDGGAYELGMRFRSAVAGHITGIRFYKDALNTGTHTAHLWTADGQPLATATFASETASGWQEVDLSSPLAIAAGTSYIVSYTDPNGHFSVDRPYFTSAVTRYPLTAPADGDPLAPLGQAGNGLFGAPGAAPDRSSDSSSYWVDVVFAAD